MKMTFKMSLTRENHSILRDPQQLAIVTSILSDLKQSPSFTRKYSVTYKGHIYFCRSELEGKELKLRLKDIEALSAQFPTISKETFIRDMKNFKQIDLDDLFKPFVPVEVKQAEPERSIEFSGMNFNLSKEIQKGMEGGRRSDHFVSKELLIACLMKKRNVFKKATLKTEKCFSFYFNIIRENREKILNVVVNKHAGQEDFVLLTAYYPTMSILKYCFNFSDVQLRKWNENVCKVKLS